METITIEKIIKFENEIDSIDIINIDDELRYNFVEQDSHAQGNLLISGSVNTLLGRKDFKEEVDVDIYAPFEKKIDKDNFKIKVKDYSYMVKNKSLIVYIILQFEGIIDNSNSTNESIVEEMNKLNEINEEETLIRNENKVIEIIEEVKEVKSNNKKIIEKENKEEVKNSWSKDLFKLNDSNVIFHKFKLK